MDSKPCDVLIVGAGLAGLAAARLLTGVGYEVLVLEAQPRAGGRLLTEFPPGVPYLDVGAQFISPGQETILSLVKEFELNAFPAEEKGKTIDWYQGNRSLLEGPFPSHEKHVEDEARRAANLLTRMAEEVPLEAPWEAPDALEKDSRTLQEWLHEQVPYPRARGTLLRAIVSVYRGDPTQLSLLGALFYIRSTDALAPLVSHKKTASVLRVEGGAQQLADRMAQSLGERILLGERVREIEWNQESATVKTRDASYSAKRVVVTAPPVIAGRIFYHPALPVGRDQLMQRMPMSWVIKVHCFYKSPFWQEQGLSGSLQSDEGAVRMCVDNSPPSGTPGILLGYIGGKAAQRLSDVPFEERREAVLRDLVRYFGREAENLIGYHEKNWGTDPFSGGCYGGFVSPGLWTSYGPALRTPIGVLHWAGAETSPLWNGKMEGALLSGERVAKEVIDTL